MTTNVEDWVLLGRLEPLDLGFLLQMLAGSGVAFRVSSEFWDAAHGKLHDVRVARAQLAEAQEMLAEIHAANRRSRGEPELLAAAPADAAEDDDDEERVIAPEDDLEVKSADRAVQLIGAGLATIVVLFGLMIFLGGR
jgi:hypothetical protein